MFDNVRVCLGKFYNEFCKLLQGSPALCSLEYIYGPSIITRDETLAYTLPLGCSKLELVIQHDHAILESWTRFSVYCCVGIVTPVYIL